MPANRIDLNTLGQKRFYQTSILVFITLSLIGIIIIFLFLKSRSNPNLTPISPLPSSAPAATPTPTLLPPADSNLTPLPSPSPSPTSVPPADPSNLLFESPVDGFKAYYQPHRQVYQDKEASGNRYTFYAPQSSITVHVGQSWSWQPPQRQFSSDFLVAGQPTYRYDINQQTIVDFEINGQKFTLQCLHRADPQVKSECFQFFSDFSLL